MTDYELAVLAISNSSLIDFADNPHTGASRTLVWAQWCRDICCAARDGETDVVESLASVLESAAVKKALAERAGATA